VRIAVAQYAPGMDKDANLATAAEHVAHAAEAGARVVVLPEYAMFTPPRVDHRSVETAEPLDGPFVEGLRRLAERHALTVVAGVNEVVAEPGKFANCLLAIGADGSALAAYRKLHLYDAFGVQESAVVQAGEIEPPQTFTVDGLTFGVQTCYDLRFPEVTRRIVEAGAQVLLLAAEWVPGPLKEEHWRTLVRARAIENTLYVAASAQNAPTGSGHSMVVDPMGVVLAALGEQSGIAVAEVSLARIEEVRMRNPVLRQRRFAVVPQGSAPGEHV
jgi:deaminated glutathione amidase